MLVVVDMQNHILDPDSKYYVPNAEKLLKQIKKRLEQARKNKEFILFTRDIPVQRKGKDEEKEDLQIISLLSPRENERVIKKYYFTMPPEALLTVKQEAFHQDNDNKQIEMVGIETNLCVLSNTIALQSVFPEADFFIDTSFVSENKHGNQALELLKDFNVEIK
ncbi:isochorismatase [Enterococcus villorum]|uniref:Isochorismatase n=1 Tax=Enterococcus villorum TaxID=112904 RepID=A0A1V8YVL5_9ENTE|nr:isochorismatase family cysteine hydrolase [Enterococcus villorum]OQO71507.1 isochorismatase [Enterococcus villorum]OQO76682.1 isochorismatase [Enterococcus villorum]